MRRFDFMVSKFVDAIERARLELEKQGFEGIELLKNQVLEKGGIKKFS